MRLEGTGILTGDSRRFAALLLSLVVLLSPTVVRAGSPTIFNGTGDWNDPARWSSGVPSNGVDVIISSGAVTLSNSTAILGSYLLNANCTNMFLGTNTILYATNVTIAGTITHSNNLATTTNASGVWEASNIVYIVAYSDVVVQAGGKINVDAKGFQWNNTGGDTAGNGPGAGHGGGGGSYGGRGGGGPTAWSIFPTWPTLYGGIGPSYPYGSYLTPLHLGSAGGSHSGTYLGGNGGGAIRIEAAGRVTVDGTVSANGAACTGAAQAGGGSGGSVYIVCCTFSGTGVIRAAGGASWGSYGGGGGGGRVAVVYTNLADQTVVTPTPSVQFVLGGRLGGDNSWPVGEPGTLYLPDTNFWPSAYTTLAGGGQVMIPGFTSWSPASLTITNSGVQFPNGFTLTVAGAVVITNAGELILTNGSLTCGGNLTLGGSSASLVLKDHAAFNCGGNVWVTNTGMLSLYPGLTNTTTPPDSAVRIGVTGGVFVANNSYIYPYSHPTNGGSALLVANTLTVAAGGKIDADGKGFAPRPGDDVTSYGPGAGNGSSGASYGGRGGTGQYGTGPGSTYGSYLAPVDAGSGGGNHHSNGRGGAGGGSIHLEIAGQVTIDGTLTANGASANADGGNGSGGGIYIVCDTIKGSGVIQANGANGGDSSSGKGGGGRMAIVYTNLAAQQALSPALQFDVKGPGTVAPSIRNALRGTLYFPDTSILPKETVVGNYWLIIPGLTNWAPNSLTITNGSLQFAPGFVYSVTNAVLIGTNSALKLTENSILRCGNLTVTNGFLEARERTSLSCDSLTVAPGGYFSLYGGVTNTPGGSGCWVNVSQLMLVQSNAVVYSWSEGTNGGSPYFTVGSLTVAAGGQINADGLGFSPGPVDAAWGYGPGGGKDCYGGRMADREVWGTMAGVMAQPTGRQTRQWIRAAGVAATGFPPTRGPRAAAWCGLSPPGW